MQTKFQLKIFIIFSFLTLIFGCSLITGGDVVTYQEFKRMVQGDLKNAKDVASLFPSCAKDAEKRVEYAIKNADQALRKIINLKSEERTFANTAKALDEAEKEFHIATNPFLISEMVSPQESVRNACHQALIKAQSFAVDAFLNVDLYNAFKAYVDGNGKTEKLTEEERYYLSEEMKEFVRGGLNLPEETLKEIKELQKEIARLSLEFESNIAKDKSKILVDRQDLDGLKDCFINNLKKEGSRFVLGVDYPTYFEIMDNCKVGETRKKLSKIFGKRAYPINVDTLNKIISTRDKLAKKLGFKDFSSFNLDNQMAQKVEKVEKFLNDLNKKALEKSDKEFEILTKDLPDGVSLSSDGKFYPWDFSFVKTFYKKKHFDIDEREIAKYFPVQKTIEGIFNIYQTFLNLRFEQVKATGFWHNEVELIQIYDKDSDQLLGFLILDLYPRDNKYNHACMDDIVPSVKSVGGEDKPGVIIIIANFPKATAEKPALLKHNDVETFFHEFGHAMHGLLGKTKMASLSGTNVKTDFVEVPSQMFEEWMWDKDMIKMVSGHYKNGQPLPDEIIDKKIKLKKLLTGFFVSRQCWLSKIALEFFKRGQVKDTDKIVRDLHEKYSRHVEFDYEDNHFQFSFGHLTNYGAGYYSYLWSKVFSLDLFYEIKKHGLLDFEIGKKFINKVIGRGGSCEPDVLLKDFLGREPNQKAFLKEMGFD